MGDKLRLTVGILGNAASMLLYTAPILTFSRVIKKRSTEEFSCVPYILALTNCYFYTWYGLPIVSYEWENFTIVTINGLGVLLELSFIFIYFWFATARGKKKVAILTTVVTVIFVTCATISAVVFHDHHYRKILIGSIGLVASVAMYCSPLVVVKQVLKTKSVEFMPFYLSMFSFITSLLWLAYGLLSHDFILASPNLVGCPFGILQLALYFKYRKRGIMVEPQKWDVELQTFIVKYSPGYNENQKKKAASILVTTKGIVFFSTDMETREFIVIGDVNREDVVSKLKNLGGEELDEKKQRRIKFRKILSKTFSHKFRVKYGEYNEQQMKEAARALVSTKGIVFFSIDMKTRKIIVNGDGDVNLEDVVISKLKKLGDAELLPSKRVKFHKFISKSFKVTATFVGMTAGGVAIVEN